MVSIILSTLWLLVSTVSSYLVYLNTQNELTALGVVIAFLATAMMIFILKEAQFETDGHIKN
jgi:hypothetical protein